MACLQRHQLPSDTVPGAMYNSLIILRHGEHREQRRIRAHEHRDTALYMMRHTRHMRQVGYMVATWWRAVLVAQQNTVGACSTHDHLSRPHLWVKGLKRKRVVQRPRHRLPHHHGRYGLNVCRVANSKDKHRLDKGSKSVTR